MRNLDALMQCVKDMQAQLVKIIKGTPSANLCHSEVVAANQAAGQCVDLGIKSDDETHDADNQNHCTHDANSINIGGTKRVHF